MSNKTNERIFWTVIIAIVGFYAIAFFGQDVLHLNTTIFAYIGSGLLVAAVLYVIIWKLILRK